MYKPPENTNRVKAIKNKFENNNENNSATKTLPSLSRQLSDPIKVNIKRSPAFRNDKVFQRNGTTQISCRVKTDYANDKIRNAAPKKSNLLVTKSLDVDNNFTNLRKRFDSQENLSAVKLQSPHRLRERSNTSAELIINKERIGSVCRDFNGNRKCFDSQDNLNTDRDKTNIKILDAPKKKEEIRYENVCMLYTEPIPKSLRNNRLNDIHTASTLKIGEKITSPQLVRNSINTSTNRGHTSCCHDDILQHKLNALTDTLKSALKKPLPPGPAPKKPPRTFVHSPQSRKAKEDFAKQLNSNLKKSLDTQQQQKKPSRGDPKYMLDKLESALKNNKIRLKKSSKVDYTTEEENKQAKFNFNCLQSLSCSNATYEAIGEPKAFFTIDAKNKNNNKEEPVYAEPFVFPGSDSGEVTKTNDKKANRNSLYYMSTPVATNATGQMDNVENHVSNHGNGEDASSLSTPSSSDIDSVTSTHSEDGNGRTASPRIRDLIQNFEHRRAQTMPNVENRVERLSKQLRDTIEHSFHPQQQNECISERESVDGESTDVFVGKFETYVRTIRMISRSRKRYDGKHLFYCCLLVGLSGKVPYIKFQFPHEVDVPFKIEELCFPDSADASIDCSVKAQNYSIVITNDSGERIYGYCRRVLPENSLTCLPLAYCILSKQRATRFYKRILQELESRHGLPDKMRDILLNEFYYHRFPLPGETIRINLKEINKYMSQTTLIVLNNKRQAETTNKENIEDGNVERKSGDLDLTSYVLVNGTNGEYGTLNKKIDGEKYNKRNGVIFHNGIIPKDLVEYNEDLLATPTELIITLHEDSRYKEKDLEELCSTLNITILQKVFASLLLERKVIFISCLLGKLSTCIDAIQNMLYPFSWPHTLIPVVPKDLWEIVEAPTPVICGALSLSVVNDYTIDDAIVVDLDVGSILMEVGDETKIIPPSLLKEFKDGMSLAHNSSKENEGFNVLLSDAFLRIFINSCGHYKNHIKDGNFQKEEFVQHPKRKSVKRFLKWFTETTMFCAFIDTVLTDSNSFKIFDKRIQIYGSQDATLILEKMKDWKKEKSNTLFF